MSLGQVLMMLSGLLLVSLLLQPLAERIRLPLAAVLVLVGFVGSELITRNGLDTGLDYRLFHELIIYAFLPLLVFSAAFRIDAGLLRQNLWVILLLAIPVLLITVGLVAVLVFYGIGQPEGFPWVAAWLTGAVLAATDASPISSRFAAMALPKRLRVLLEGEDLFNDATAIVVFGIALYMATHPQEPIEASDVVVRFLVVFFGGGLIGLLIGLGSLFLSRLFEDHIHQGVVTLVAAYSAFLLAHDVLHVSGIMAVLVTALVMGRVIHNDFQDQRGSFIDEFWSFVAFIAEALMFLLVGFTLTLSMFEERWLAMLIGIGSVLVGRVAALYVAHLMTRGVFPEKNLDTQFREVMFLGSLRGAVVVALALSLPTTLPWWWTVQSIAFGVVVFSLFVQAPLALHRLERRRRQ
ncbi:MAG: sodium:proton antiporter [Gammaproteobacteria bacterium]|nr:MAG: sodium:proton antiporter [Gammaproteobacteria bacterium]